MYGHKDLLAIYSVIGELPSLAASYFSSLVSEEVAILSSVVNSGQIAAATTSMN